MKFSTATLVVLLASLAFAGDDPVTTVAYTGTQGCTAALQRKRSYSVQCTTDCFVRVTDNITTAPATSNSVLVGAGKLYDAPTTERQTFICAVQSAASGTLKVFLYRGPTE